MSSQVQEGERWTTIKERTNQTLEEGGADVTESDAQQDSTETTNGEGGIQSASDLSSRENQSAITFVPVDIWLMIAECSHPYSILQLTRTSKFLRRTFTSKELSNTVWRRAINSLDGFPKLLSEEIYGPKLVAFVYEDTCFVCGGEGATSSSEAWRIRWHGKCQEESISRGHNLLQVLPHAAVHCLPQLYGSGPHFSALDRCVRCWNAFFLIDEARKLNSELLDYLKANDHLDEAIVLDSFCQRKQPLARKFEQDGRLLSDWFGMLWYEGRTRFSNTFELHHGHRIEYYANENWRLPFEARSLSDEGWNSVYRQLEKDYFVHVWKPLSRSRKTYRSNLLKALRKQYFKWLQIFRLLPPFPFFVELPSIRKLLDSADGPIERCIRNWAQEGLDVTLRSEAKLASCWIQRSYGRLLLNALARIPKPISSTIRSSLFPENSLLPPAQYDGVDNPWSTSGILLNDPATITKSQLDELLNRFSHQAWYHDSQPPQSFLSAQSDNCNRLNSPGYRGPLFPRFNTFWCQVLCQILEKTGIRDGAFDSTTKTLRDLGPYFSCGACISSKKRKEEITKMDFTKLLKHLKEHRFSPEDTPDNALIVYDPPVVVEAGPSSRVNA